MAKNKPTTPAHSVEVLVETFTADDGCLDTEEFDWFDLDKRKDFLKRMDALILKGSYFQVKPT